MTKINYIIIACFVTLISCNIDRLPYDSRETSEFFGSEGGIEIATLGIYSILKGKVDEAGWASNLHRIVEYAGDNVSLSGSSGDNAFFFYNYNNLRDNNRSNSFWKLSYKTIVGANKIIELSEKGQTNEKDQLIGENYYLRALVYFQAVNVYGRPYSQGPNSLGIPLKLTSDINDRPDRNTVGEVYEQIVKDLETAESLMTVSKSSAFATNISAKALLSRVHLYMENNERAAHYATEVIESGEFSLLPTSELADYMTIEPENNLETIFAIKYEKDSDYGTGKRTVGSLYANIQNVGWGEMYASKDYLDLINKHPEDRRKGFIEPQYLRDDNGEKIPAIYWVDEDYNYVFRRTFKSGSNIYFDDDGTQRQVKEETTKDGIRYYVINNNNNKVYVTKDFDMEKRNGFPKFYILKASLQQNIPQLWSPVISRLAEMYLNRAEANSKMGNTQLAIEDVNIIRKRAGIPTYNSVADFPEELEILDVVLQERRLELAFEGHRKFDIFRNNKTLNRRYPGSHLYGSNPFYEVEPQSNRVVLYIPENEIIVQPSLEQNP
jgi:hypothetical protein